MPRSSSKAISNCPPTRTVFSPALTRRSTVTTARPGTTQAESEPGQSARRQPAPLPPLPEKVDYDLTLQNPNCVFQLLKKHYSRYTPEMVERITGIPKEQFLKAADLFTSIRKDGDMKKVATIIYAVGWTQHSFGTQIIRTAAMLQLLLGNVGRAGGGVNALRGHSNIQGATDMAGTFDNLPGYLKVPDARRRFLRRVDEAHNADGRRNPRRGIPSTTGATRRSLRSAS